MILNFLYRRLSRRKPVCHLGAVHSCESSPNHDGPNEKDVTVVVPTRDKMELLVPMIESLLTTAPNVNVLVIDNQSKEFASMTYLSSLATKANVKVIQFDEPFNFARISNFAVRHVRTDFVLFANNDLIFREVGWLGRMLAHLNDPAVGVVGAKLNYYNGDIQHAGIFFYLHGLASHFKPKENELSQHLNQSVCLEVSGITFALALLRRSDYISLGGMDEKFWVGLNDVDLCLRYTKAGFRIICCLGQNIVHFESKSRSSVFSFRGFFRAATEVSRFYKKHGRSALVEEFFTT